MKSTGGVKALQAVPENHSVSDDGDSDFSTRTERTNQDTGSRGEDFSPEALVWTDNRVVRLVRIVHFILLIVGTLKQQSVALPHMYLSLNNSRQRNDNLHLPFHSTVRRRCFPERL